MLLKDVFIIVILMYKKSVNEETAITQCETPPNLELVNKSNQFNTMGQMMHKIISSNEELIHEQMKTIKQLQISNFQKDQRIQSLEKQYEAVLEYSKQSSVMAGENAVIDVQSMIHKITVLESLLSTTKVQLAIKTAQMMDYEFNSNQKNERKSHKIYQNKYNIESYFVEKNAQDLHDDTQKETEDPGHIEQWAKILENWNKNEQLFDDWAFRRQKILPLIKKFIPNSLRGKLWVKMYENKIGVTNGLYIELLALRQKGMVEEKVKIQIQKDIKRSFSGKTQYQRKTGLLIQVCELLQLFHLHRPDVSYVQGMTYPVIILIPIVGKIKAFQLFSNLILSNYFFRRLFTLQAGFITIVCRAFESLLFDYQQSVYQRLIEAGVQAEIYLIQWLFTFFSRGLSYEGTLKFWDHLLVFGQLAIFRLGLCIFELLSKIIYQAQQQSLVSLIRDFSGQIKQSKLIDLFGNHKLSSQKMYKAMEKYR